MGEVYEAEDLELHEQIALKTIGGAAATSRSAIERFKREIHLARRVTHPNVCRIFDLGQHQPRGEEGAPPPPPVVFLTMELLQGETLAQRLRREGRFSTDEALPVARQIAAALEAAHGAGVIHRDLKSDNVFLENREDGEVRVVVTDFGVARGATEDRFASLVTGGGIVGTPAYMAPEQVEGTEITPAADVYAFGVVLYEMVTGQLPFQSDNPLTTAVKRLKEAPPPPHVHVPHLESRWENAILRCLARHVEDRYERPSLAVEAVERPAARPAPAPVAPAPAASPTAGDPTKKRGRLVLEVALLVLLVILGAVLWTRRGDETIAPRRAVAVLGFKNSNPQRADVDWLSTALAEMLGTELARGENLRTIPGETVARARRELEVEVGDSLAPESLRSIRTLLGCDYVVLGSYLALAGPAGELIRLDLKLQDAGRGQTLAAFSRDGSQDELFGMVDALGAEIREALGVEATETEAAPVIPRDAEAARLYAEALDGLRASEPLVALERLQEAVRIEPEHPMIHSALSMAWQTLGDGTRALEAASRAFDLSTELPEEERLLVEGRLRESQGDWSAAATVYDGLWQRFPDNLEYGLRLAAAETEARRPQEALSTVSEIRRLPEPLSSDPRIDLAEAAAAALVSDFDRQLGAAQKAAGRARELGADLLLAQARLTESQAWRLLGKLDQAANAAAEAIEIHERMQNRPGVALATTTAANVHFDRGELDRAAAGFEEAIEIYRVVGQEGSRAFALNNLALVLKRRGRFDGARSRYQEAEAIYRELGNDLGLANTLNNLASLLVEEGRLATAREMFERSLEAWSRAGNRHAVAFVRNNIGVVLRLQGELEASRAAHETALATRRELGHQAGIVASLANLAAVLGDLGQLEAAQQHLVEARGIAEEIQDQSGLALVQFETGRIRHLQGQLEPAAENLREALALREALEEDPRVTDTRLALAHLALDLEDPDETEVQASLALGSAADERRAAEEALAEASLARVALTRAEPERAAEHLERARELTRTNEQPAVQWRVELTGARVAAHRTEQAEEALGRADRLGAEIREAGHTELALEARLVRSRLLFALGRSEEAREELITLQSEASVHGLGLFSRRAEQLLNRPPEPIAGP